MHGILSNGLNFAILAVLFGAVALLFAATLKLLAKVFRKLGWTHLPARDAESCPSVRKREDNGSDCFNNTLGYNPLTSEVEWHWDSR